MKSFIVNPVGEIRIRGGEMYIELDQKYIPGLKELGGFSHVNVVWWFDGYDTAEARNQLQDLQPYKNAPDEMGVFATRSPIRPNPIALTASQIIAIDDEEGVIQIAYIDANDHSPVLDLKPYTPSLDRVERPEVPLWCRDWPKSMEESAAFDWSEVFNF